MRIKITPDQLNKLQRKGIRFCIVSESPENSEIVLLGKISILDHDAVFAEKPLEENIVELARLFKSANSKAIDILADISRSDLLFDKKYAQNEIKAIINSIVKTRKNFVYLLHYLKKLSKMPPDSDKR